MAEFFIEYGLFLAKAITIVAAIVVVLVAAVALSSRGQSERGKDRLEVKDLNRHYDGMALALQSAIMPKKAFKEKLKARKKQTKQDAKNPEPSGRRRVFVLNFDGDIRASAVAALREEVSAVLSVATADDEVLLRLESPGGVVNGYGLAASQLARITERQFKLTVAVDKVAASGGYMMACVGSRILAAPFAVLGSIGVVAQVPNVHRLLKKNAVDVELFTAGEYKRTVTMLGENSDRDRQKFQQDLDDTHQLFKEFVSHHRTEVDIDKVATGEIWYGSQAQTMGLVDEVRTSDDYLMAAQQDADLYEVSYKVKKSLLTRLLSGPQEALTRRLAGLDWPDRLR